MIPGKLRSIKKQLERADSYEEWLELAHQHDKITGGDKWRMKEESPLYDNKEIRFRLDELRRVRAHDDYKGVLFLLNEGIHGNMGGMGNSILYSKALTGTKHLIEDYINEINDALLYIAEDKRADISLEDKLDFFDRASICFGHAALMLSGGARLGNFHLGVLKALAKQKIIPKIISGASAGAIFAGLTSTKTDEELEQFIDEERILYILKHELKMYQELFETQRVIDADESAEIINSLVPDLTFQEAYEMSGRKLNVSVAPNGAQQKSRLLNAVASPNVLIRSAIMASCAVPGVYPPVTLMAKNMQGEKQPYLLSRKWVDGSMSNDLPSKRLSRLYGANHFIVSLTNPFVLPFVNDPSSQKPLFKSLRRLGVSFIKETTQFNYSLSQRLFPVLPKSVAYTAKVINSIVQQDYTGDINIIANFRIRDARKLLKAMSFDELRALIKQGERATFPKIEAIRVTTKVGRTLNKIIKEYEGKVDLSLVE